MLGPDSDPPCKHIADPVKACVKVQVVLENMHFHVCLQMFQYFTYSPFSEQHIKKTLLSPDFCTVLYISCFILYCIIKNRCDAYKSISHLLNQPGKKK